MQQFTYVPIDSKMADYIAYQKAPIEQPDADGVVTVFRPQTYVREFQHATVSDIRVKKIPANATHPETEFANVSFNGASVGIPGMSNDFGAMILTSEAAYQLLTQAKESGGAVTVVIETVRKSRDSDGVVIDPATPMDDLRGVTVNSKGRKSGNAQVTGRNCKNLIVGVGVAGQPETFQVGSEVSSDPAEWVQLRKNINADRAPQGWRLAPGGITSAAAAAAPSAGFDAAAVKEAVREAVSAVLPKGQSPFSATSAPEVNRPAPQTSVSAEARPWVPFNSDGRLNASGYVVVKQRAVTKLAAELLTAAGLVSDLLGESARLAKVLLWVTDQVHTAAVGAVCGRHARLAASHYESSMWVEQVICTFGAADPSFGFRGDYMADKEQLKGWAQRVIGAAIRLQTGAIADVTAYLDDDTPAGAAAAQQSDAVGAAAGAATEVAAQREQWLEFLGFWPWGPSKTTQFAAILCEEFGVADPARVEPGRWQSSLAKWASDRPAFLAAATAAHEKRNQS